MGVCDICTEQRNEVDPELIESSNSSRGLLSHVQCPRLTAEACTSPRADWHRLLDEIGDFEMLVSIVESGSSNLLTDNSGAIEGKSFAEFDESDCVCMPRNLVGDSSKSMKFFLGWHFLEIVAIAVMDRDGMFFNSNSGFGIVWRLYANETGVNDVCRHLDLKC